ncbi:hypothetical protein OQJ65_17115 [Vibrio sp. Sgm 22]|uniref:hypothetical protein n=1 Tax=unclassified Vibrio TaxID=2614977 RepID=UPI002248BA69|nr:MULTISPECIES: hypothetical protein [unclassified Vibrio]MCX2760056.1 hypothetical protein [Vibrio sp. 14G-20]MCX2777044.1 hypothetical protein [Vibrio sp. Sgm 22]
MKKLTLAALITAALFGCKATDIAHLKHGEPVNREYVYNDGYDFRLTDSYNSVVTFDLPQFERGFACGNDNEAYPAPVDVNVSFAYRDGYKTKLTAFVPYRCKVSQELADAVTAKVNEELAKQHQALKAERKAKADTRKAELAKQSMLANAKRLQEAEAKAKYQQTAEYEIKMAATVSATAQLCADNLMYLAQHQADKVERVQIAEAKKVIKSRGQKWNGKLYNSAFNESLTYMSEVMALSGGPKSADIGLCRRLKTSLKLKK